MTSEELAQQVNSTMESLRSRIMGTGKEQYDRVSVQLIETFTSEEILINTLEEIDDAIVYLAHIRARLASLERTIL